MTLLSEHGVDLVFFSDEKVFTEASPVDLQNNRIYVPSNVKKRNIVPECLLRCRPTFSSLLMVSVAVSKLGCTELLFVQPGVKVYDKSNHELVLKKQMLPVISSIAGDVCVSAGQRTGIQCSQGSSAAAAADATIYLL